MRSANEIETCLGVLARGTGRRVRSKTTTTPSSAEPRAARGRSVRAGPQSRAHLAAAGWSTFAGSPRPPGSAWLFGAGPEKQRCFFAPAPSSPAEIEAAVLRLSCQNLNPLQSAALRLQTLHCVRMVLESMNTLRLTRVYRVSESYIGNKEGNCASRRRESCFHGCFHMVLMRRSFSLTVTH